MTQLYARHFGSDVRRQDPGQKYSMLHVFFSIALKHILLVVSKFQQIDLQDQKNIGTDLLDVHQGFASSW